MTPRTLRDASGAPIDYDGNLVLATGHHEQRLRAWWSMVVAD